VQIRLSDVKKSAIYDAAVDDVTVGQYEVHSAMVTRSEQAESRLGCQACVVKAMRGWDTAPNLVEENDAAILRVLGVAVSQVRLPHETLLPWHGHERHCSIKTFKHCVKRGAASTRRTRLVVSIRYSPGTAIMDT
jgi:hypothetical protein